MSEANRVINLDDEGVVEFTLGGRPFAIRQQRRAVLEKVLRHLYAREQSGAVAADATIDQFVDSCFGSWRDCVPTLALMLGIEEDDPNRTKLVDHLDEHLSWSRAKWVFQQWWGLNGLVDFFALGGNPMVPEFGARAADEAAASPPTPTSS